MVLPNFSIEYKTSLIYVGHGLVALLPNDIQKSDNPRDGDIGGASRISILILHVPCTGCKRLDTDYIGCQWEGEKDAYSAQIYAHAYG